MSIGPTFVRADEGNFYKEVSIKGDDFFICFDENDPPELVIMKKGRTAKELEKRAEQIIRELKIQATIKNENTTTGFDSERCFNDDPLAFKPARAYFLDITKPIPLAIITKHSGVFEGKGEGTFECFEEMDFPAWRKLKFGN